MGRVTAWQKRDTARSALLAEALPVEAVAGAVFPGLFQGRVALVEQPPVALPYRDTVLPTR